MQINRTRMYPEYQIRQPAKRYARIGVFYACLVPVIIGLMVLVGTFGLILNFDQSLNFAVAIAFLVGTPIVAWLSQQAIAHRQKLNYRSLVEVALMRASIVQIIFGFGYMIYFTSRSPITIPFVELLGLSLTIYAIVWGTITLPLTLICCLIFKHSALRPIYR